MIKYIPLMLLMGCATTPTPIKFDYAALNKQWQLVKERQPIVWGKGEQSLSKVQEALDTCRATKYISDRDNYGLSEYWATPDEYFMKGGGDCEDTAICTYYKLAEAGFDDIHLMVGNNGDGGHAILTVKTNEGYYVLDNVYRYPIDYVDYIGKMFSVSVVF